MKFKCKCAAGSPFHWRDNLRPSIFVEDKSIKHSQMSSASQTAFVERSRRQGVDISFIPGLSKSPELRIIAMKQFTTYSKAVVKK